MCSPNDRTASGTSLVKAFTRHQQYIGLPILVGELVVAQPGIQQFHGLIICALPKGELGDVLDGTCDLHSTCNVRRVKILFAKMETVTLGVFYDLLHRYYAEHIT